MSPDDTRLIVGRGLLQISQKCRSGYVVIDMRYQYKDKATHRYKPTLRGITFGAANIDAIISALHKLRSQMIDDGYLIYDNDNTIPRLNTTVYPQNF
jgi:hypothetical protein